MCANCVCACGRAFFHFQGLFNNQKNAFLFLGTIKILKSTKHKQPSNKNNHYDIPKIHYKNESLGEKLNQSVTDSNAENIVDTITNDKVSIHTFFFFFLSSMHIKSTR
jgi:hypothetical protein